MTTTIVFMPAAATEVREAQNWYEKEQTGLGAEFRAEVDRQIERIRHNPFQFQRVMSDVHRMKLKRFPYGLFFRPLEETIYVIACFHSSRDPMIWQRRI